MFKSRIAPSSLLALGCLAVAGSPAPAADKQTADIVVRSVEVQATKKNGDAWDAFGGAPDLKVFVRNTKRGGAKHTTQVKKDTLEATFGANTIRVSVGDEVEVIVYDEDANINDKVGEKTVKITEQMLKDREVKWDFDRVISLTLEFEP